MAEIVIRVNGEERILAGPVRLLDLLATLRVDPHTVAVELNRRVLPRASLASVQVEDGDRLEIIRMVGGG